MCVLFEYMCVLFEYMCVLFEYMCVLFEYMCVLFEYMCVMFEYMCVLFFSKNLCETFLILRRTERDVIKIFIAVHVKYPLFLSDFNET